MKINFEVQNTEKRRKYFKKAMDEYVMLNECFLRSSVRKQYGYGFLFKTMHGYGKRDITSDKCNKPIIKNVKPIFAIKVHVRISRM